MRPRDVAVGVPTQKPAHLAYALFTIDLAHRRYGAALPLSLLDHEVPMGHRRDLRQVGHDYDLMVARDRNELSGDTMRDGAADPGVDLVEDEGRSAIRVGERGLERQ
jgi:hypothetical protein